FASNARILLNRLSRSLVMPSFSFGPAVFSSGTIGIEPAAHLGNLVPSLTHEFALGLGRGGDPGPDQLGNLRPGGVLGRIVIERDDLVLGSAQLFGQFFVVRLLTAKLAERPCI